MWVFIGKNVDNELHGRRLALTQNDPDNGFELWRAIFIENEGGAEQVTLGGMSSLHSFPQCTRVEDVQHWLGQWQMTRQRYGNDLPEAHLRQMFLNMLPDIVSSKLRERRDLSTLQQYIDEVTSDLGRLNDAKLAKIHMQRMSTALKSGSRTSVNAVTEESPEPPRHEPNGNDEISKKLDTLISALSANHAQPRGRQPQRDKSPGRPGNRDRSKSPRGLDPAWEAEGKGCLHCAAKGHKRRECNKFKKLLSENGDSLPTGYKGASEKWKEARKKTSQVASVTNLDVELEEFAETDLIWSLPTRSNLPSLPCPCCPINNRFNDLEDIADRDDEYEVMAALQQLTSKITVGPKKSQKQKKQLDKQRIAKIAQQVQDGIIELPDLILESNAEYAAVWALIDSGAGRSCANRAKHFPGIKTRNLPSSARMATANGHELKSRGVFKVHAVTREGMFVDPEFEDVDVDIPIIAVNDLSKEDTEVVFRHNDNELVNVADGRTSKFVKRRGVCFMKIFYQKRSML